MKKEKVNNVAETIGNLILSGYTLSRGVREDIGESIKYSEITLQKRYAYYDDEDNLQGFDEEITINVDSGEAIVTRKPVEKYKRYSAK